MTGDASSHHLGYLKPAGESPDGPFADPREGDAYALDHSELGAPYTKEVVPRRLTAQHVARLRDLLARGPVSASMAKFCGEFLQLVRLARLRLPPLSP